jgi:Flp pilus assembly pilin Flp
LKVGQRLPHFRKVLNQKGQTLVEFVLLLAVISLISYGFVSIMNRNIGAYWEHCVNLILHDKPGEKTAKID